jgi:hypothetical protein
MRDFNTDIVMANMGLNDVMEISVEELLDTWEVTDEESSELEGE